MRIIDDDELPKHSVIVAYAVEDLANPIPGSTQMRCGACTRAVWTAPTTHRWLAKHPTLRVLCMKCGHALMQTLPPEERAIATTPQQLSELRRVAEPPK